MENKKKFPRILIVTIIISSFAIIFLTISIITSILSIKRTEKAISNIGKVSYVEEIEEKIDKAIEYYDKLDTNIGLNKKVNNKKELDEAKYNYVRLGIKKAVVSYNRRYADEISDEDLKIFVNEAYSKLKKYFKEDEYEDIEGYDDFKPILDIYKEEEKESNNDNTGGGEAEEPEIC